MEAKQIRIKASSSVEYWYSRLEGKVFWVTDSEYNSKYKVVKGEGTNVEFLLDKSDCEEIFSEGEKVHYDPMVAGRNCENGMVKEIAENGIRVVFHCNEDWKNFRDYTGQLTSTHQLRKGWI